jgi:hypothetical protein
MKEGKHTTTEQIVECTATSLQQQDQQPGAAVDEGALITAAQESAVGNGHETTTEKIVECADTSIDPVNEPEQDQQPGAAADAGAITTAVQESAADKGPEIATEEIIGCAGTSIVPAPFTAIMVESLKGEPQLSMSQGSEEVTVPELSREEKEHHASILSFPDRYRHCVSVAGRAATAYGAGMGKLEQAKRILGDNIPYFQRLEKDLSDQGRRENIDGVESWQEFLVKYFSWCSLATAKRAIKAIKEEYEQSRPKKQIVRPKSAGLTKHDSQRLLKADQIGGKLAEKHRDEPEAMEYLSIANQASPLFGTDPQASSQPTYEVLAASLDSIAVFIADLYRPGFGSANVHENIRVLKIMAEDTLKTMAKDYAITLVPPEFLQPPQEKSEHKNARAVEDLPQEPVDAAENTERILEHSLSPHPDEAHQHIAGTSTTTVTFEPPVGRKTSPGSPKGAKPMTSNAKTGRSGTDGGRKPAKSITADGVAVATGFTCKFNGQDCRIAAVFPGDDPTVSLIRLSDGTPVEGGPIPSRELRFVTDPAVSRAG